MFLPKVKELLVKLFFLKKVLVKICVILWLIFNNFWNDCALTLSVFSADTLSISPQAGYERERGLLPQV